MGVSLIPTAVGLGAGLLSKLGIGGSSGQDPQKNAVRQQQLTEAEAQALQANPQAIAELETWNRPGPTNALAQQFVQQHSQLIPMAAGTSFTGNYGQFDPGVSSGGAPLQVGGTAGGSGGAGAIPAAGGLLGLTGQSGTGNTGLLQLGNQLAAAQATQQQQNLMNQALSSATSAYNAKQPLRQAALAGLANDQGPNLSSVFASGNPYARSAPSFQTGNPGPAAATMSPQAAAQSLTTPQGPAGAGISAAPMTPTAPQPFPGAGQGLSGIGAPPNGMIPLSSAPFKPPISMGSLPGQQLPGNL